MLSAAIRSDTHKLTAITWETLATDPDFVTLREAINQCFLHVTEDVIIYNDRIVVPPSLRNAVLDVLHSAHQGASKMALRARLIVFWPGMTEDIQHHRS